MAKKGKFKLLNFLLWLTGVIVSLAVGNALIVGTLTVPYLDQVPYLMAIAGWVVIIATVVSVIMAILDYAK